MKRAVLVNIALLALGAAHPAMAADMPVKAGETIIEAPPLIYNWTGLYVGVNGGGAWGQSRQDQITAPITSTGNFNVSGGLAGGTAGFNVQFDQVVFGLEGDLDWARISGTAACPAAGFSCTTQSDYLATIRGRLGYAWPWPRQGGVPGGQWLVYVTGGAAAGDINQSFSPAVAGNSGISSNRVGWTAGGGIQYGFYGTGWSVKVEYLYVDLGTFICTTTCSGIVGRTTDTTLTENIFRVGLNYRFW